MQYTEPLILKPRLKQYMEFNITTKNFLTYDDQIHLNNNTDNSFFFHRYYGNYCDTAWFSGSYQTSNRRFGRNEAKIIGLGIDYENSIVSWYLNGSLQYSDTLAGWSDNARPNDQFNQYNVISIASIPPYPTMNIEAVNMQYPIPDGYISVYEGSYPYYKLYGDKYKYSYKN